MKNSAFLALIIAIIFSSCAFTLAEIFILNRLKYGESSKQIFYAILANLTNIISIGLGVFLLIAFTGIGLFVAMDKGYNSGEKYLTLAIVSIMIIPLLIFLARGFLFYLFKLGDLLTAFIYSFSTTLTSLFLLAIITFATLAVTS